MNYVELDYPRDMSMFSGVGYNIDAVFQWKNGKVEICVFLNCAFINLIK